jgi:hypothetical protein
MTAGARIDLNTLLKPAPWCGGQQQLMHQLLSAYAAFLQTACRVRSSDVVKIGDEHFNN